MIQNLPEQLGSSLVMDYTPPLMRDSSEKKLIQNNGCSLRSKSHGKSSNNRRAQNVGGGVHGYLGDGSTQDLRITP